MAYILPTTLTIKNVKPEVVEDAKVNLWNTGLEAACPCGTGEAQQSVLLGDLLPACNTKEFAGTVQIPVFGNNNQYFTLKAGQEIQVTCHTDAEALFYLAMHKPGILEIAEHESLFDEEEAHAEEGESA